MSNDINNIAISPDQKCLILVDLKGLTQIINLISMNVINYFNFKNRVNDIKFSPDGRFLAACTDTEIRIFHSPDTLKSIEPLILHKKLKGQHSDAITKIEWSPDSRFILSVSKDLTVKMQPIFKIPNFIPLVFTGLKQVCISAFFDKNMNFLYLLGRDGNLLVWEWVEDVITDGYKNAKQFQDFKAGKKIKMNNQREKITNDYQQMQGDEEEEYYTEFELKVCKGRYILAKRETFHQPQTKLKTAQFHYNNQYLIIGFKNGIFGLYQINKKEIQTLQTFSLTNQKISSISINSTGNWIAFGIEKLGQMIIWEWRSQTYIYNQQGLSFNIECLDFSLNGNIIATGGADGKIKLWDSSSFFCFATFTEHQSKVTGVRFIQKTSNTLISSSLDGTIRAYDTQRYRNFRIMKPDIATQLGGIAIDPSGDIICSFGNDPYNIYVFSLQTGQLLESIPGHESQITCIQFSPLLNLLGSSSWDKTVQLRDLYVRQGSTESLQHNSEVTAFAFKQDGEEVCSATAVGEIILWSVRLAQVIGLLDCKRDILGGRLENSKISLKILAGNKHYKTIAYSSDGDYIIAGGETKYLNLYELRYRILMKKYQLTKNKQLDGVIDKLSTKNIKDGVILNEIDEFSDSDYEERKDEWLPGAKRQQDFKRKVKLRIECKDAKFSPDGRFWAAATTEGLQIFSLNNQKIFTPYELDETISIDHIVKSLKERDYYHCLIISFQLNQFDILEEIFYYIPITEIPIICQNIPLQFLFQFFEFLSQQIEKNKEVEFILRWLKLLLFNYYHIIEQQQVQYNKVMRHLLKIIQNKFGNIFEIFKENQQILKFLQCQLNSEDKIDISNQIEAKK